MTGCLLLQSYGYLWEYLGDSWNWVPAHASDSRFSPLLEFIAKSLVYIVKFMLGITPPCSDFSIFFLRLLCQAIPCAISDRHGFRSKSNSFSSSISVTLEFASLRPQFLCQNCGPPKLRIYQLRQKKTKDVIAVCKSIETITQWNLGAT